MHKKGSGITGKAILIGAGCMLAYAYYGPAGVIIVGAILFIATQ